MEELNVQILLCEVVGLGLVSFELHVLLPGRELWAVQDLGGTAMDGAELDMSYRQGMIRNLPGSHRCSSTRQSHPSGNIAPRR